MQNPEINLQIGSQYHVRGIRCPVTLIQLEIDDKSVPSASVILASGFKHQSEPVKILKLSPGLLRP